VTASATNYIEATRAGVVSKNAVGFTGGSIPHYTVVTGAALVTSYTDNRGWVAPAYLPSNGSVAVTAADVDLTVAANADTARCSYLTTTGFLTANRNVIVPNSWQAIVFCNNSGAFTTTFKTAAGAGVVVAREARHAAGRRHQRRSRNPGYLIGVTAMSFMSGDAVMQEAQIERCKVKC
jgi:hypothetical protein